MSFSDWFGGTEFQEPKYSKASRGKLYALATGAPPEAPELETAEVDPLQQRLYELAEQRLASLSTGSSPYDKALATVGSQMDMGDPTQSAIYKGILSQAERAGTQSNRNIGRALRKTGNSVLASSKGRDILGRNTDQWQQGMAVSLADYVAGEKNRQLNASQLYSGLLGQKETAEGNVRAEAGHAGDFMRAIAQERANAEYAQAQQMYNWVTQISPSILSSLVGGEFVQDPGILKRVADGVGSVGNIIGGVAKIGASFMPSPGAAAGTTSGMPSGTTPQGTMFG